MTGNKQDSKPAVGLFCCTGIYHKIAARHHSCPLVCAHAVVEFRSEYTAPLHAERPVCLGVRNWDRTGLLPAPLPPSCFPCVRPPLSTHPSTPLTCALHFPPVHPSRCVLGQRPGPHTQPATLGTAQVGSHRRLCCCCWGAARHRLNWPLPCCFWGASSYMPGR